MLTLSISVNGPDRGQKNSRESIMAKYSGLTIHSLRQQPRDEIDVHLGRASQEQANNRRIIFIDPERDFVGIQRTKQHRDFFQIYGNIAVFVWFHTPRSCLASMLGECERNGRQFEWDGVSGFGVGWLAIFSQFMVLLIVAARRRLFAEFSCKSQCLGR